MLHIKKTALLYLLVIYFLFLFYSVSFAQSVSITAEAVNPLIGYNTLLLQWDYSRHLGPMDHYLTLNIQPSLPFHLNDQVDMIAYSDLPINSQMKMIYTNAPGMKLGDYQQYLFFSQAHTGNNYLGVGPVFTFPTATDQNIASGKWGIGPALQAAVFGERISYGIVGYYLWSYAGDPNKSNISHTYWNPWLTFTIDKFNNWGLQTEPYFDFISNQGQVPLEIYYNHFALIGSQLTKFTFDGLYWPVPPSSAPNWTLRFNITLFWPTK
jgi:hypothetical protein